jgi:hypothetical protein
VSTSMQRVFRTFHQPRHLASPHIRLQQAQHKYKSPPTQTSHDVAAAVLTKGLTCDVRMLHHPMTAKPVHLTPRCQHTYLHSYTLWL